MVLERKRTIPQPLKTGSRRIPEDLSVVTFGGRQVVSGQLFTTLIAPEFEVGRCASEMLVHRIQDPGDDLIASAVPFGLDTNGSSLAPAPA